MCYEVLDGIQNIGSNIWDCLEKFREGLAPPELRPCYFPFVSAVSMQQASARPMVIFVQNLRLLLGDLPHVKEWEGRAGTVIRCNIHLEVGSSLYRKIDPSLVKL